jgi:hypothetical protein
MTPAERETTFEPFFAQDQRTGAEVALLHCACGRDHVIRALKHETLRIEEEGS